MGRDLELAELVDALGAATGGRGYEHFPRFHHVMAEDSGQSVLSCL